MLLTTAGLSAIIRPPCAKAQGKGIVVKYFLRMLSAISAARPAVRYRIVHKIMLMIASLSIIPQSRIAKQDSWLSVHKHCLFNDRSTTFKRYIRRLGTLSPVRRILHY